MKKYINDILPEYKTFEIQDNQFPSNIKWLKNNIRNTDIICLTGGGNMGTRYRLSEAIRRIVIETFSENLIIIFPQTFDYIDTKYDQKERKNAIKTYSKAKKLIVTAREMKSYNTMLSDYEFASVLCIPDMALYLKKIQPTSKEYGIRYCLRKDTEKKISNITLKMILSDFPQATEISTYANIYPVNIKDREHLVLETLLDFAKSELVITDRLHAMIFCYLTNTPCLALPNANGKSENIYYQWLKECPYITFQKKYNKSCINKIINYNFSSDITSVKLKNSYEELSRLIISYLK